MHHPFDCARGRADCHVDSTVTLSSLNLLTIILPVLFGNVDTHIIPPCSSTPPHSFHLQPDGCRTLHRRNDPLLRRTIIRHENFPSHLKPSRKMLQAMVQPHPTHNPPAPRRISLSIDGVPRYLSRQLLLQNRQRRKYTTQRKGESTVK